ncbi:GNAT family N-acetyltransferase [Novosphingobium sp.]|uniref:GNAT family N-acetyltransferase n=1 Tax=Novosphingobium sp. TaxID=1874826 RepID=UPI003D142972
MTLSEWWALWHADPRATPFQSPAWLDAWWEALGSGERRDVLVRDDDRLVAALPMRVWQDGATRRLVPVGAGESDYCDALVDPAAGNVAERLMTALLTTAQGCDEVLLPDLREGSPLLGPVPDDWISDCAPCETCPVLTLPETGPLLPALTKSQRRKVVHDRHRAANAGGAIEAIVAPDDIDAALDALFSLHEMRWAAVGQAGVLADPRIQSFHRAAAPALAAAGLLRLVTVTFDGRCVAVLLGFADASRGYSYINGVANTVPGQSFGSMAFATLIERAVADGAREFHFLRGEEDYKYQWGAKPTYTVRRTLRRR